jgi:hypothetical protein
MIGAEKAQSYNYVMKFELSIADLRRIFPE